MDLYHDIMDVLGNVKDPEIDTVSVLDLGMIEAVNEVDGIVQVNVLPTFMGCPALDILRKNIETSIQDVKGVQKVTVTFLKFPHWTSERITEKGRENLKKFGIAPPPKTLGPEGHWSVNCPYCDSAYTTIENLFGPTACRSILYCKACKNPFEAMKPISTIM
ncbi:phenylacetate-CoA oxygenase subunit PaaJ [Bacillus timonensis]|nr:phenylacetate-CoA oxygenase subunit PaaJ [Bacillus timonensis]